MTLLEIFRKIEKSVQVGENAILAVDVYFEGDEMVPKQDIKAGIVNNVKKSAVLLLPYAFSFRDTLFKITRDLPMDVIVKLTPKHLAEGKIVFKKNGTVVERLLDSRTIWELEFKSEQWLKRLKNFGYISQKTFEKFMKLITAIKPQDL